MTPPDEAQRIARAKWEGEMERALLEVEGRLSRLSQALHDFEDKHDKAVERIEEQLGSMGKDLTEIKTKVLIYGGVVGGVGTLIMLLILAVATNAIPGAG